MELMRNENEGIRDTKLDFTSTRSYYRNMQIMGSDEEQADNMVNQNLTQPLNYHDLMIAMDSYCTCNTQLDFGCNLRAGEVQRETKYSDTIDLFSMIK
jgi:hypothetical protein